MEGGSDKESKVFCASPSPNPKDEMSVPKGGRYFFYSTDPCKTSEMQPALHGLQSARLQLHRGQCIKSLIAQRGSVAKPVLMICDFAVSGKAMLPIDTRTGAICILVPRLLKETPSFRVEELPSQQCKSDCAMATLSAPDLFTRTRRFSLEQCSIVTSWRPRLRSAHLD